MVIHADFTPKIAADAIPEGFLDIDDLVEQHERDPERKAAIEEGRRTVAREYYANKKGLAVLRLRKGWSQRTLAEAAGMKQPHIARLESGQNDPSLDTMRRLAHALGISIEELVRELVASEAEQA
ncbi:MAG: helix-turn-helix transcriptional regulator [Proteobacteria bacterium]|jgi:ribosome-binding protein aMBF1 (putative translation factor)|nr:helix-turn-helix transcriptional regulator [Pseudomonadota bacterium]MCC6630644.1 helix-turn-helix transcriptional regulator [Gammaproteobacteria bacterium]